MKYITISVSVAISLFLSFSDNIYAQQMEDFEESEHMIYEHDHPTPIQPKISGTTFIQNIVELRRDDVCGRITCLVIDKTNSNHLIAGANTGGLWESNDRGKTWSPIDDHLPSLSIFSIAQDPVQTNIYYASSFEYMQATGSDVRPDILKSTDGGKTFQLLPATAGNFTKVRRLATSPNTSGLLYALSGDFSKRGLYRSADYGKSFTKVFTYSGFSERDVEVMPDGSVIITVGADVYRSPNGNSGTFNLVSGLNGTNTFTNMDISYCASQPDIMYGLATGGTVNVGVFKSTDAGKNWTYMKPLNVGRFTNAIGVKPDDPDFVIGGSVGIELTQNGGNSFIPYTAAGVDYWSVNYDPANPDRVFTTLDHGINEFILSPFNSDPQQSIIERDSMLNASQIYYGDYWNTGDRIVIGMQDNGTLVAGNEKANVGGGSDGTYCYFHKQDSTVIYFASQNGRIMKKENVFIPFPNTGYKNPVYILNQLDADNNNTVDDGASFVHPFWMNNADGEQLYFPTRKKLWRSTDGGDNWQPISGTYSTIQDMDATGNNKLNPIVYWTVEKDLWVMPNAKTATAGDEFQVTMPGSAETITLHPNNDSIVYMVKGNAGGITRINKSSNIFKPNVQWQDITGDLPNSLLVRCIGVNPDNDNELVLGTERGLYVSGDGGQHWKQELQFPSVIVSRIKVRKNDKRIFIFSYGRGAWAASFPGANSITDIVQNENKLAIWPNPGEDVIHVGAENITGKTSVQLYSLDGKLLRKLSNLQHTPVSVNVEDLPAGNYIISTYEGAKRTASAQFVKR